MSFDSGKFGVVRIGQSRRVTRLKAAYESGLPISEIGNLLGVSKIPVNKALVRHGIPKRSSGQSQRKKIGQE